MSMHKNVSVLVAVDNDKAHEPLFDYLKKTGCILSVAVRPKDVYKKLENEKIDIFIVDAVSSWCDDNSICKKIRKRLFNEPFQIILLVNGKDQLSKIVEYNADDGICRPYDKAEIEVRMEAAFIRLQGQLKLANEREFYRKAVKQEEELTVKILDQHIHLKEAFSNIEAINKELTLSNKRLERVAKYDVLSGLLNRASLFGAMDAEIERAIRSNSALSGILFDIDHFKSLNDDYGHLLGDEVIRTIGARLSNALRKYDVAGRYGGEEFFALLPNTNKDTGLVIAERFKEKLKEKEIQYNDIKVYISASFGVSQFVAGESRDMWIDRIDKAMYMAKESGRDQVIGL